MTWAGILDQNRRTNNESNNRNAMSSAAALRLQIERSLASRIPAALSPVPRAYEAVSIGVPNLDALLNGGLPVGAISEIVGAQSTGRTSLTLAFLAKQTQEEKVCAWVDVDDALDPESAAASGVELPLLLWFRCRDTDMRVEGKPWSRLDQALKAMDLLLQTAGFGAIVLDLGDTAAEYARRIPLATWFRFRQAASRSRTCVLVLGLDSYVQSAAEVVLECSPGPEATASETVLDGLGFHVRSRRRRFSQELPARKPPASTWSADTAWNVEKQL